MSSVADLPVATGIETNLWYQIILAFVKDNWTVTFKYDNFDAGIDADFVILEKENEEILFGWDNWFEGEIQCTKERMADIEAKFQTKFTYGDPTNLKPAVVEIHRAWRAKNLFNNPGLLSGMR